MKKNSYIVFWLVSLIVASWLVACGGGVSNQLPVNSDPNFDLLVAQAQLTGTAQAFAIQVVGWTATAQAWTVTPSSTPVPTSTPTITFTPTVNATGTMMVERMNAEIEDLRRDGERKELTNGLLAFLPYVAIVLGLGLIFFIGFIVAKRLSYIPTPIHESTGKAQPMLGVLEGTWVDIDVQPNGAVGLNSNFIKSLPAITSERMDATKNRAQLIDLQTRRGKLPRQLVDLQSTPTALPATSSVDSERDELFPLPAWNLVNSWKKERDLIPCGMSGNGMEYINVNHYPHLAVFGMTRSGKSRRGLRPLVTFMLASNQRVVLIGKEVDFLPFLGQPNVVFIPIYDVTERVEAEKYAAALAACVEEKNQRIKWMASKGVSLWEYERTWIVLDELGNAVLEMPNDLGNMTMNKARSMVNEGGKAGMSLVFSAQRPKGFVDLTTQCARIVFNVETDQERGFALGMKNAHQLREVPAGYFYKKTVSLQLTGAFEPSDDEIRSYLNAGYTKTLSKPDWIMNLSDNSKQIEARDEAVPVIGGQSSVSSGQSSVVSEQVSVSSGQSSVVGEQKEQTKFGDEIIKKAEELKPHWIAEPKISRTKIARILFNRPYGGDLAWKIGQILEYLSTTTTTTTENVAEMPVLEGFLG